MMVNPHKKARTSSNSSSQRTSLLQANAVRGTGRNANNSRTQRKRERHDVANEIPQSSLVAKVPKQEGGVRTRAQRKAALREKEHMLMSWSIEGKAVLAVQEIIALVNSITYGSGITIETITKDDMVYFTEKMLRLQQDFMSKGISGYVDVGYHYTSSEHIAKIRQHGLLTRCDRNNHRIDATFHGSVFGDGVYTASNPDSFASYGNTGVLVARLPGKMVRVRQFLPKQTQVYANTIVGDKMTGIKREQVDKDNWPLNDAKHEYVLQSSSQCVPMIKYDRSMRKTKRGKDIIKKMEKNLLDIFDKYFNEGLRRSSHQDAEILSPPPILLAAVAAPSQRIQGSNAQTSTALAGNATATSVIASTRTTGPPRSNFTLPPFTAANSSSLPGSRSQNGTSSTAGNTAVASTFSTYSAANTSSLSGSGGKIGTSSTSGNTQAASTLDVQILVLLILCICFYSYPIIIALWIVAYVVCVKASTSDSSTATGDKFLSITSANSSSLPGTRSQNISSSTAGRPQQGASRPRQRAMQLHLHVLSRLQPTLHRYLEVDLKITLHPHHPFCATKLHSHLSLEFHQMQCALLTNHVT